MSDGAIAETLFRGLIVSLLWDAVLTLFLICPHIICAVVRQRWRDKYVSEKRKRGKLRGKSAGA